MARIIRRGQIWTADLNPGFGIELHKKRPVLIISNNQINKYSPSVIVVPLSSQIGLPGPERVFLSKKSAGIDKDSVVLAPEIRSIDKIRLITKIGLLSSQKLFEVEESLGLVLGMIELN